MTALVSTGKWHPTPTGDFTIWEKIRATRMTGGEGADFYDLPNVPYVMFFGGSGVPDGDGFSLHGAYWHDNFGHPMSHGCVNMRIVDAEKLYDWADPPTNGNTTLSSTESPGTEITIYGQAPL
jgi:lipoprotein-anchoring transpeptidase ErfK/SrfK